MEANVNPVPDGYHTLTPALTVEEAEQAIDFYKQVFNAEELTRMKDDDGSIMHAEVKIGDSILFLGDEFPERNVYAPPHFGGSPASLWMYVEDVDGVYEKAIKEGAKGEMDPEDMFWGDRMAQFIDPFGHVWSIATHVEDLSEEEIKRREQEALGAS